MNDIMDALARIAAVPLCAQGVHKWPSEEMAPLSSSDECRFCGKTYSHWWLERTLEALGERTAEDTGVSINERIICGEGGHGSTTLVKHPCPCGCEARRDFHRCNLCLDITEMSIESCLTAA